jgi:hypothetical protein
VGLTGNLVLEELSGGLWHTTPPDRYKRILESGSILPAREAGNPDGWKSVGGEDCCPYAEKLGGLSLFDFVGFDPERYSRDYPLSSWREFVPYREKWGSAVWIEIDRKLIAPQFISGPNLVTKWNADKAYRHNFMPYIEAVHLGPLPRGAFKRAFLIGPGYTQVRPLDL